ncbi:hypothetical protein H8959_007000 [Pygathrix nigripes]
MRVPHANAAPRHGPWQVFLPHLARPRFPSSSLPLPAAPPLPRGRRPDWELPCVDQEGSTAWNCLQRLLGHRLGGLRESPPPGADLTILPPAISRSALGPQRRAGSWGPKLRWSRDRPARPEALPSPPGSTPTS